MENKKELLKKVTEVGAAIFTNMAHSTADSACIYGFYQPKEPKCLREEK